MNAKIPLFDKVMLLNMITLDDILAWKTYVLKFFVSNNEPLTINSIQKAINYNVDNISTTLSTDEFNQWCLIIEGSQRKFGSIQTSPGECLRKLYEKTEKLEADSKVIEDRLTNPVTYLNHQDIRDFFSLYPNDYSIFENVCAKKPNFILDLFVTTAFIKSSPETFNYFARYIYTTSFIERNENLDRPQILGKTRNIFTDLDGVLDTTYRDVSARLDFFLSILTVANESISNSQCIPTKLIDNNMMSYIMTATHIKKVILEQFEKTLPNEYKQYRVFESLDVAIRPSELYTQLSNKVSIESTPLPEFI